MLDTELTLARVVLDHAECAPVLQRHRIDFCCRGDRTLREACEERSLDVAAVVKELEEAIAKRSAPPPNDPRVMTTAELIGHIVEVHHAYLANAMPFVDGLAQKVARVHGDKDPRLVEMAKAVKELLAALEPHLQDEEGSLFPALLAAEPAAPQVERELRSMKEEHLVVGRLLERIRGAADDFNTPPWACNSYRALFAELEQLEADILRHVHLENHVLMPRFC